MTEPLLAPFPWFGGKSTIAAQVWERLGNPPNYVEPFFGSGAVLLQRPDSHAWWNATETVNDLDGLLCNFWRAVQAAPDEVAHWADWPVNENDLHARHAWLVGKQESLQAALEGDPDYYDAKAAGWWVWGICIWIGSGWCSGTGPWRVVDAKLVRTDEGSIGIKRQRPDVGPPKGINRELPHMGRGRGVNRQLSDKGNDGEDLCEAWSEHLRAMMRRLADRLRRVRVCCGDWSRVLTFSPTTNLGVTGVFLDPPYSLSTGRAGELYAVDTDVSAAVREWAIANGDNPQFRIALCGYEGEHQMPETWSCLEWTARGGYSTHGEGNDNRFRERVWFSPHCLPRGQPRLF